MNRRAFLRALGTAGFALTGGCDFSVEDGLFNPCLPGPMPEHLLKHDLVQGAVAEVDPSQLWDCHVHVAGVGDGNTGIWMTSQMRSLWHPWQRLQHRFYLNASA